jgi:hypothetical protein
MPRPRPKWWLRRPCLVGMSDAHLLAVLKLLHREALRRGLSAKVTRLPSFPTL